MHEIAKYEWDSVNDKLLGWVTGHVRCGLLI